MWASATNYNEMKHSVDEARFIGYLANLRRNGDYSIINTSKVTGTITQGWKDLNTTGPLFQDSLWNVICRNPNSWTPVEYLFDYAMTCKASNEPNRNYDLGRAIRNLPSFMREYFLHTKLVEIGIDASIPDPSENAQKHADIFVNYEGRELAIWSFLDTPKSLKMLERKILYRMKSFPEWNIFAPFLVDRDTESILEWHIPSNKYAELLTSEITKPRSLNVIELDHWLGSTSARQNHPFFIISGDQLEKLSDLGRE